MNKYSQLIKKAKTFFDANQFESAHNCILNVLNNYELDLKTKSNLYLLLADINTKLNNFKDTNIYLLKYLKINSKNSKIYNSIANNHLRMREYSKAKEYYLNAINLNKDNEAAIINLAILLENLGKKKEALKYYDKAIKIDPKNLSVLYNMNKLEKKTLNKDQTDLIKNYIKSNDQDFFNIASGYFLLAENEIGKDNIKSEVSFLQKANGYSFKSKERINEQALNYWLNIIPKKFDNFTYVKKSKNLIEEKKFNPIFIVGLPRSGSTITETIISSDKNHITALGETNLVNWSLINTHRKILYSNTQKVELNLDLIHNKLINSYKNLNIYEKNNHIRFVDKSLENFFYIDLILKIFPNAKFIHTHRNLQDNIFSIYKEFLNKISWSHSLDNIFFYIDNYLKVIRKIKEKHFDKIISVSLEELTINPKDISNKIYQFCNLEWDENCLNYQKRENLYSSTASNNQIRSGIQNYNNKKYEKYQFLIKDYKSKYDWL